MLEKLFHLSESHLDPSLLALLIVLYYLWLLTKIIFFPAHSRNLPPSPPKLPIVGNLHQVGRHLPHHSLATLSKKYGPLMSLQLGNKSALVISSAEVLKEVVKTHSIFLLGSPKLITVEKLFYGRRDLIFSPYGDHWKKLRTLFANHLFDKRMIKSLKSIRDEETSNLVENINKLIVSTTDSSPLVNLSSMFSSMTSHVVCRFAFGKKYMEGDDAEKIMGLIEETTRFVTMFTVGEFIPWLGWMNRWNGFDAALEKLAKAKEEVLNAKIQEYQEASNTGELGRDGRGKNLADVLTDLYNGNTPGITLDMDVVKAIIQDVLGAGTMTTSTTLGWAMTELIRHPKTMKKLQDEVRGIVNGKQTMITDYDLEKMPYLKAVVKEILRLHTPAPIMIRETVHDHVPLMGYDIPSGMMVVFNWWAICQDPQHWGEPEKFLPERFLNSAVDYKGFDFQFVPFGAGRRICPGMTFATTIVEHVLANLMLKFDWQLPNGAKGEDLDVIEKVSLVVGRKNPLIVVPRKCRCL